ncbi:hypothetical protein D5086_028351 [Populus alba]|uniref:Uncharacterized protein n=1 Tax=Populus alba TaxID=43335 RepID=A0ACC4AYV8_POPAL
MKGFVARLMKIGARRVTSFSGAVEAFPIVESIGVVQRFFFSWWKVFPVAGLAFLGVYFCLCSAQWKLIMWSLSLVVLGYNMVQAVIIQLQLYASTSHDPGESCC